jgi:hypothetical protein
LLCTGVFLMIVYGALPRNLRQDETVTPDDSPSLAGPRAGRVREGDENAPQAGRLN